MEQRNLAPLVPSYSTAQPRPRISQVLNAVMLWTTRSIDAAVARLRAEGYEILDEDGGRG